MENEVKYLLTIKYKENEPHKIPITFWDTHTVTNINDLIQVKYLVKEKKVRFYTVVPSNNTSDSFEVELDKLFDEDNLNNPTFTTTIIIDDEFYIFERGEI